MNEVLDTLEPKILWKYFGEILQIPRPSKKEEKIRAYLVDFAKQHNLECKTDKTGNVLIRKPATPGHENRPCVILQSHMDMVCEKNGDSMHNFDTDPIKVSVVDGWLKAEETTLGADNGLGCATELAILASDDIEHGPIECLFTVDEETGLTGAFGLEKGFLNGKILLNMDSEDDGLFFIGCAGGIDTVIEYPFAKEAAANNLAYYQVAVKGLVGGHSGDDINKGRANANQLLARCLYNLLPKTGFRLASFNGGNLRNAIAREAVAVIGIEPKNEAALNAVVADCKKMFAHEYRVTEANLDLSCTKAEAPAFLMADANRDALVYALLACPHGVLRMSDEIENFVETSTNLASVKTLEDHVLICTSQRSSVESAKHAAAQRVAACFKAIGAKTSHSEGYPGWNPNPNSPILKLTLEAFKDLFHEEGKALAIHAGLECGLFSEKYPDMDMVSYGPTMRGVHAPGERVELATVTRFWQLTKEILKRV
ncbi:MAG: aminoacyl-histidine dipeptidase [Bacteroides sp.]|nr:aminoacyl-histidine dipeptidase [Bacteroides sp.]MCM1084933.1 aminoacyl-histidine dipeptidase [Bacteroides sp.]MCM1169935.1 aminoacyl-histidine dipeptidase [Bacteroides sp.]